MKEFLPRLLRNKLAWLIVIVLVGGGIWYFRFKGGATGPVTYETQAVERGNLETSVASSGTVTPLITVVVGSEVSGKLTDVFVDFNAKVTKGQLLAQVDPSTFKSKLESAQADLIVQQATVGSREVDVSNSQVIVDQSKRDLDRATALFEKGLNSANDLEKARNAQEQAQNNLKIAKANLNNARSLVTKMQAALNQAKLDLARTQIRAPVDGVVVNRKVDPGQTVQASMQAPELFQVAQDLSRIKIETKVDEADIGSIKEGARATFTVDAYPERTFTGVVAQVRINGTAVQNVVTYSCMVQADNPGLVLLPGMTANVKIVTAERQNVLRVASAALRFRPANAGAALPAADAVRTTGGGAASGRGGGTGQRGATRGGTRQLVAMTPEIMKELGLSEEQQTKVASAMQELAQRSSSQSSAGSSNPLGGTGGPPNFRGGGGGNGASDAQTQRTRMMNALGNILTPEQMQKYQALGSNTAVRPGTVYVLGANGAPEAKSVRVGLATDNQTEMISGLDEGEKVIVRSRTESK